MKLKVTHEITTTFDPPRRRFVQSHRLHPGNLASQKVLSWKVDLSRGTTGASFTDGAGNVTTTFSTPGDVSEVTVSVTGEVETVDTLGVLRDFKEKTPPTTYLTPTRLTRSDPPIAALAKSALAGIAADAGLDRAHALTKAVGDALETVEFEELGAPPTAAEALEAGEGSASDQAHLLIALALTSDMPARFVCGYRGDVSSTEQWQSEKDTLFQPPWTAHGWAELWVEGLGWVGFDPANACCPDENYIRLCSGRDVSDAAPLRGLALGQGGASQQVRLDVAATAQ
ncbi:MAG: transglutaminase family protein [Pseudomonadota bacterium]